MLTKVLHFNSLVLIPSIYCNSRCDHCYPECGPGKKVRWDIELLRRVIREASQLANLRKSIHIAGGEPFLFYPDLLTIARYAQQYGFRCSTTTNGFWGGRRASARTKVAELLDAGLYRIELSCDSFHQKYIPLRCVKNCIAALREKNVYTTLRVITTRKHQIDETIRKLRVDELDGLDVVGSPVVPTGRAKRTIHASEYYLSDRGAYAGRCSDSLNLTVKEDGNVAPCCAGADVTPFLSIGNVRQKSIIQIAKEAEWNIIVKQLVYGGPASFFKVIRDAGLKERTERRYTNICHACCDLFSDPEIVAILSEYAQKEERERVRRMFGQMLLRKQR